VRWSPGQKPGMPPSHDPADDTVGIRLPPSETVPVVLVVAAVVAGIALLAAGRWPYVLILLGVAALLGAVFRDDEAAAGDVRETLAGLDRAEGELEERLQAVLVRADGNEAPDEDSRRPAA